MCFRLQNKNTPKIWLSTLELEPLSDVCVCARIKTHLYSIEIIEIIKIIKNNNKTPQTKQIIV